MNSFGAFEEAVAAQAGRREADGIIFGHIQHAADRVIGETHYLDCGDWVERCTAIVETRSGAFGPVRWLADGGAALVRREEPGGLESQSAA